MDGVLLGWKFHRDHERPGAILDGVAARAVIVPIDASADVPSDTNVMSLLVGVAAKEIDEALANPLHGHPTRANQASVDSGTFARRAFTVPQFWLFLVGVARQKLAGVGVRW